jgi:hypothetical protein
MNDSEISGLIYKTSRHNLAKIVIEKFGPSTYTNLAMETWDKIDAITDDFRHQILDELEELHDFA